jgi:hypothetical protein
MAAEFEATVRTSISFDETTNTATVLGHTVGQTFSASVTIEVTVDATFEVGERITVNGSLSYEYVGHVAGGWVGVRGEDYFLFSNTEREINSTFTVSVTPFPVCFLEGTRIATLDGLRAVETLAIGDLVTTADGTTRPVRWIGRQTIVAVFADPLHAYPIRVAGGALGDGLPVRDLFVSPDHALLVDGLLVQASALVNGTTITRAPAPAPRFTYFHVELADHALILAEGVAAETFVDHVTRRRFDNFAEFEALYGAEQASIAELAMPRIKSARQLPRATRERLAAHAPASRVAAAA